MLGPINTLRPSPNGGGWRPKGAGWGHAACPSAMRFSLPLACPRFAQQAKARGVEMSFSSYFQVGAPLTLAAILLGALWL